MQRVHVGLLATTVAVVFISGTAQSVIRTDDATVSADEVAEAERIALDHLRAIDPADTAAFTGLRTADSNEVELRVDSTARSEGVTHVYVQQQIDGIDLLDGTANVAVTDDGEVAHAPARLVSPGIASEAPSSSLLPAVGAIDAVELALEAVAVDPIEPLRVIAAPTGTDQRQTVADGGVNVRPFDVALSYAVVDGELRLGWSVEIEITGVAHGRTVIAVDDGSVLRTDDYQVAHGPDAYDNLLGLNGDARTLARLGVDTPPRTQLSGQTSTLLTTADGSSYRVFPIPVEAPSFGNQQLVSQPADSIASPFGWHDNNGVAQADFTTTTGNNVVSVLDLDSDNLPDANGQPDGGPTLQFNSTFDGSSSPTAGANPNAAVTQAFYAANWAHDFFYAYGFDEAAGNFQLSNYGRGGTGSDPVIVDSLDGYGLVARPTTRNNATFTTPPDGLPGRMDLEVFTLTLPERSASFDNGVIVHEYAHGWSTRLTGGRENVNCLSNAEQMGEGWSDFAALMATTLPTDNGFESRGVGSWLLGQSTGGRGIRQFPYSRTESVDPRDYSTLPAETLVHGVGSIWAAMLWDLNWELIDQYGFDPDLARGSGGNNIAMQLVTDGLKLQPCSPGFVDGRDAILAADRIAYGGAHQCLIWEVFTRHGLGYYADQGSPFDITDGTAWFGDAPPCLPYGGFSIYGSLASADRLGPSR